MKKTPFAFPEWINELVPDDDLFARAYQDITDLKRAWLKTAIARLYDLYGPRKNASGTSICNWNAGFQSKKSYSAVDYAIVLFDGSLLSPSRLLAALVPALAGGVKQVLAVRVGNGVPWRNALLTGLELAGQELVVDMTESQVRQLLDELGATGSSGIVAVLGPKAAGINYSEYHSFSNIVFWRPRFNRLAAVWMEDENSFDLEVMAFIHPDITFTVFGTKVPMPADNFTYADSCLDNFIEAIGDVAYVSVEHMACIPQHVKLLLGPGQEGCWAWPDLHPELFQFHSIALTSGD